MRGAVWRFRDAENRAKDRSRTPQGEDGTTEQTAEAARRQRIDGFVRAHFRLRGALRLHANALGWDMLRAPVNVALAPVILIVRLVGAILGAVGLRRVGRWLGGLRIGLRTRLAGVLERHIVEELLEGTPRTPRAQALIEDYVGTRAAVAEITTMLVTLSLGIALFSTATPGMISLAPVLSSIVVEKQAIASFPLGARLGGVWYGVFPVSLPVWFVVAVGVGLAMAASVVTTFAGLVADPVQAHTGVHRRRLMRLLKRIEAAEAGAPPIAGEHLLARSGDVADAVLAAIRHFRS